MENWGGSGYQGSGAGADDSGYDQSKAPYQADNDKFSQAQGQGRFQRGDPNMAQGQAQGQGQGGQQWNQGQGQQGQQWDQGQGQGQGWKPDQGQGQMPLGQGRQGPSSSGAYAPGGADEMGQPPQVPGSGTARGSSTGIGGGGIRDEDAGPGYGGQQGMGGGATQPQQQPQQQRLSDDTQQAQGQAQSQGQKAHEKTHTGGIGGMMQKAKKVVADIKGDDSGQPPKTGGHGSF